MTTLGNIPGPWTLDDHALAIWAPSAKGGETKIFDVRGWGYLTGGGHGALGLCAEDAKAIQRANGKLAAAAPDMRADLKNIATQKTTEELIAEGGEAYEDADFEGAYDALIHIARRALQPLT